MCLGKSLQLHYNKSHKHNARYGISPKFFIPQQEQEYDFDYAIFLRPKAYTEREPDGTYHTHIAGLPTAVARTLRLCDYIDGKVINGKLAPVSVRGGVVLADADFTLKF